jgi:predicted CoA-binding protein
MDLDTRVRDFLALKRIAVAGVTRAEPNAPANLIFRKLRDAGYQVYAVNPRAETVEGGPCYPSLRAVPDCPEGVVLATPPHAADELVRDCAELGIGRVWMHRSFGQGSVSQQAVAFCRQHGINVIAGACPMMFCPPVDFPHKCLRWVLRVTGGLPK